MIKKNIRFLMLTAMMLMACGSAWAGDYYLLFKVGNINTPAGLENYGSKTATNVYTWTIDVPAGTNCYFTLSTTSSYADMISTNESSAKDIEESTILSTKDVSTGYGTDSHSVDNYKYYRVAFTTAGSVTLSYNSTTKKYTFASAGTTYTVSASVSGGTSTISPASTSIAEGSNADFTVTPQAGYEYNTHSCPNATVVRNGNVFNVAPTANTSLSVTYTLRSLTVTTSVSGTGGTIGDGGNVNYGNDLTIRATADENHSLDRSSVNFEGTANISYTVISSTITDITLSNVTEGGVLSVAFVSEHNPVVDFGNQPTQSGNTVNVGAYLVERYCSEVTAIGFEWNTSNDFTSPNSFPYSGNESHFTLSNSRASLAALVNGDEFSAIIPESEFSSITSGTNMFYRAYVTTAEGTGYSDVVGFFYNPCKGLTSVDITPTTAQLPAGYEVTLQVVARGAGKSPAYTWYLDQEDANISGGTATAISGATSDSYTYTMPSPAGSHHIKVKVAEGECGTSQFTHDDAVAVGITASKRADITVCDEPAFNFEGEAGGDIPEITTTPWAATEINIENDENYADYEWDVEPANAVLAGKSKTSVVFRADVLSGDSTTYTVTYTAKGSCSGASVEVKKQIEVTVEKDADICN